MKNNLVIPFVCAINSVTANVSIVNCVKIVALFKRSSLQRRALINLAFLFVVASNYPNSAFYAFLVKFNGSQSVILSVCHSVSLSVCQSVSLSFCHSVSLSVCQSVSLSVCQSVSLSVCQSVGLLVCQSVSLSVCQYFN